MTIREILEPLASGWRGWAKDQLDGTSFIGDELKEIDRTVIEAEQAINAYILGEVMELLKDDGLYEPKARAIKYPIPESAKYLQVPVVGIESFVYQELRNKANERWGK